MNYPRLIPTLTFVGWSYVLLLSFIGVYGAGAHLLDASTRMGDGATFRHAAVEVYGPDFTPHWYRYREIPVARALHMLPGLIWMVLAPLQFVGSLRRKAPRLHRWIGRTVIGLAFALVPTGALFAAMRPLSNAFAELVPIMFYGSLFAIAALMGIKRARERNFVAHREWMLRAFAIGVGISSVRIWFLLFLHTSGMSAKDFFPSAFWIAFAANLAGIELWINLTRRQRVLATAKTAIETQPSVVPNRPQLEWSARGVEP